jgi:hypothetical protein
VQVRQGIAPACLADACWHCGSACRTCSRAGGMLPAWLVLAPSCFCKGSCLQVVWQPSACLLPACCLQDAIERAVLPAFQADSYTLVTAGGQSGRQGRQAGRFDSVVGLSGFYAPAVSPSASLVTRLLTAIRLLHLAAAVMQAGMTLMCVCSSHPSTHAASLLC